MGVPTDIINQMLDAELAKRSGAQKSQPDYSGIINTDFGTPKADALAKFGYDTPEYNFPGIYSPTGVTPRGEQKAIDAGIVANDPFITENMMDQASPRARSEFSGVDYEAGATPGKTIRDLSYLPEDIKNDPVTGPDSITRILQDNYRESGADIPSDFNWDVRTDPTMENQFIFNDPVTGKPRPVNPPGINAGDLEAFLKPLAAEIGPPLVAAIAAAPGSPLASIPAAITMEAMGTYFFRSYHLDRMQKEGYIPENYDITARAMKDAGVTAVFGSAAGSAYGVYKLFSGRGLGGVPLNKEDFMTSYDSLMDEGIVDPSRLTSPQVIMAEGSSGGAAGLEEFLRNEAKKDTTFGNILKEKYADQEKLFVKIVDNLIKDYGVTRKQAEEGANLYLRKKEGEGIQAAGRVDLIQRQATYENQIDELNQQSDSIFTNLTNGKIPADEAGLAIRDTAVEVKRLNRVEVDSQFDNAYKKAGFTANAKPFDYSSIQQIAESILKGQEGAGLPNEQVRALAGTLLEQTSKMKNKAVSFKNYKNDVRQIQTAIDSIAAKGGDYSDLLRLREEMMTLRRSALQNKGNKDALKIYDDAEGAFKQSNLDFDNDLIKRITALQKAGSDKYKLGDKQAYESVLTTIRSNVDTDYLNRIVMDPENTGAYFGLRDGIRGDFFSKVVDDTNPDGLLRPKGGNQYNKFMAENEKLINRFFTPEEAAEFTSPESFINGYSKRQKDLFDLKDAVESSSTLKGIINTDSPEEIFKSSWKKDNISMPMELRAMLERQESTELINSYKRYIAGDLINATESTSRIVFGNKTFSGQKLMTYADDYSAQLTEFYGASFPRRLKGIGQRLRAFDDLQVEQLGPAQKLLYNILNQGARTYVGLFTTAGRMLTGAKMAKGAVEKSQFMDLLTNPDKLYDAIISSKRLEDPKTKLLARALGREGLTFATDDEIPPSDTTEKQMTIFGPGMQTERDEMNYGGHVMRKLGVPLRYGYGD